MDILKNHNIMFGFHNIPENKIEKKNSLVKS